MSRAEEISRELRDATTQLQKRQEDVRYWLEQVNKLNTELTRTREEEARKNSAK